MKDRDVILETLIVEDTPITVKRSKGVVNGNAEKLFEYVWDMRLEEKRKYEDTLIQDDIVKDIDQDTHLRYQVYKFPWPMDNRDATVCLTMCSISGLYGFLTFRFPAPENKKGP